MKKSRRFFVGQLTKQLEERIEISKAMADAVVMVEVLSEKIDSEYSEDLIEVSNELNNIFKGLIQNGEKTLRTLKELYKIC